MAENEPQLKHFKCHEYGIKEKPFPTKFKSCYSELSVNDPCSAFA